MKLLKEIKDQDVGFEKKEANLALREAARAVVFNPEGKIALLYVASHDFYKLPGGGVEPGEYVEDALEREVLEEAGCEIEIIDELGQINEERTHFGKLQKSYCYLAQVVGEIGEPSFTLGEIADQFELEWHSIEDAIKLAEGTDTADYLGRFVQIRLLTILKAAKEWM